MVFQEGALFDSLTVRDNVAYQLIQERVPDAEIDQRVHEALRFVELDNTFGFYPAASRAACAGAWPLRARSSASRSWCSTTAHRRLDPSPPHHR